MIYSKTEYAKMEYVLGVKISNARVRVGGTSAFTFFFLLFVLGGGSPAKRASMRAGKKKGGLGKGIFARPQFCVSKNLMTQQFSLKNVRAFL